MKNTIIKIFATGIFLLAVNTVFAQIINYEWQDDNNVTTKFSIFIGGTIHTYPDTFEVHSLTKRELFEQELHEVPPVSVQVSPYTIYFYSEEAQRMDDHVAFDISSSKYIFVPFNPFYPITEVTESDASGIVKVGICEDSDDGTTAHSGGNWIYMCSCHISTQSPGGCLSAIKPNGMISCINDEGCNDACQGWTIRVGKNKIKGGGIFVRLEEKYVIKDLQ